MSKSRGEGKEEKNEEGVTEEGGRDLLTSMVRRNPLKLRSQASLSRASSTP